MAPADPPDPPDPPDAPGRGADLRAGDLVGKTAAQLEEELDPATVAQLARWFGLPSFTELAEQREESQEELETRERLEQLEAAVDPALVARLRARDHAGDELIRLTGEVTIHVETPIERLDASFVQRFGAIADPREVEIPYQLEDDLRECTPQALLRDLHRPEETFLAQLELDEEPPPPGPDAMREIREIMTTSFHFTPPVPASERLVGAFSEIRWLRAADWGDLPVGRRT
jgi:hypothetical protein